MHSWKMITAILLLITGICIFPINTNAQTNRIQPISKTPVVVIDPGHGGENFGTIENGYLEKEMTLITAQAMYEHLSKFDNVTVYMTRTEDVDLSLKERVTYAKEKNADFLFSVHYNASLNHELFGSEVWVPLSSPYNNYGYQFGSEFLNTMQDEYGLFIRGIKTRRNDKGTDYYGILREAVSVKLPAVILEHCHVDESRDEIYCNTTEKLQNFGRTDAESVARYLGLKSAVLGLDYSDYQLIEAGVDIPEPSTAIDQTSPDICELINLETDIQTGFMKFEVKAYDSDSPILYYSYSIDGGNNYTERFPWPEANGLKNSSEEKLILSFTVPSGTTPRVLVKIFNKYDLFTVSNLYELQLPIIYEKELPPSEEPTESIIASDEAISDNVQISLPEEKRNSSSTIILISLIAISFILLGIFAVIILRPGDEG